MSGSEHAAIIYMISKAKFGLSLGVARFSCLDGERPIMRE